MGVFQGLRLEYGRLHVLSAAAPAGRSGESSLMAEAIAMPPAAAVAKAAISASLIVGGQSSRDMVRPQRAVSRADVAVRAVRERTHGHTCVQSWTFVPAADVAASVGLW